MLTLAIDASTYVGTVVVLRDGRVLAEREAAMRGEHEERLMPTVASALDEANVVPALLERVICGAGPGSFTSLRIAGAIAKGLAVATGAVLVPVSSLVLMSAAVEPRLADGDYLAVLDAMRGDVFALHVRWADDRLEVDGSHRLIPRSELGATARSLGATVIGPGESVHAVPHARGALLAGVAFPMPPAADLGMWEPVYGRLAEAQVKWEAAHGRALSV
jgi:tRNA threonylcarbamoyladenosine biosynthesis protein TsaB